MQNGAADNRTRLLRAAETVTYRHGFSRTALADIAKEAKFPLGNVYYYFKTKDELGDALVKLRVQRFRKLLETFDKLAIRKIGCARSCRPRSRTARNWRAAAVRWERCARNCTSMAGRWQGGQRHFLWKR